MKYKLISLNDMHKEKVFEGKIKLLWFIKSKFRYNYIYRKGDDLVRKNSVLNRCCHHWGETAVDYERVVYGVAEWWKNKCLRELMIIDSYGRVVNIPDLAEEAYKAPDPPERRRYGYSFMDDGTEWWGDSWWWTLQVKRCKHADYMGYNGRDKKHLQQERRMACDETHKPFVRGKRTIHALDPWGLIEGGAKATISWKQMKIRKQWMEHL